MRPVCLIAVYQNHTSEELSCQISRLLLHRQLRSLHSVASTSHRWTSSPSVPSKATRSPFFQMRAASPLRRCRPSLARPTSAKLPSFFLVHLSLNANAVFTFASSSLPKRFPLPAIPRSAPPVGSIGITSSSAELRRSRSTSGSALFPSASHHHSPASMESSAPCSRMTQPSARPSTAARTEERWPQHLTFPSTISIRTCLHKSSLQECRSALFRCDRSRSQPVCGFRSRALARISNAPGQSSSTALLAQMRTREQIGMRGCSSMEEKMLPLARPRAALSPIWFVTGLHPAVSPSSSSRESRCFVPVASMSAQRWKITASRKCSSEVAPFLLQADAFSCRDALDFNRATMLIANVHGDLQSSVDAQALISTLFAASSLLPSSTTIRTVGKR